MQRERVRPRPDWQRRCEEVGFAFHTIDGTYWDESACYRFSADEIDALEAATAELHRISLEACAHVVKKRRFAEFAIPPAFHDLVAQSWKDREFSVYGRFDLAYDGNGPAKLLEYNADTPTALLEASVVQWHWMEEAKPGADQFNSIHEKLIDRWKVLRAAAPADARIVFTCVADSEEDLGNVEYLRDTALQAGFATTFCAIDRLGWNAGEGVFVDDRDREVECLFKLYPWEWLVAEHFGAHLIEQPCQMIEPAWKMLLSNKAILAVLWELFPDHPNLLPAYRDPSRLQGDYVRKPILGREGANVALRRSAGAMVTEGTYGAEGYVYQGFAPLYAAEGNYAVLGSWIVGDAPAGLGIREDDSQITRNTSRFVPHYFE